MKKQIFINFKEKEGNHFFVLTLGNPNQTFQYNIKFVTNSLRKFAKRFNLNSKQLQDLQHKVIENYLEWQRKLERIMHEKTENSEIEVEQLKLGAHGKGYKKFAKNRKQRKKTMNRE